MAKKPSLRSEFQEITYTEARWRLLENLREKALPVMKALASAGLSPKTHGSVARGDVTGKSDVDIFVLENASSFNVETALTKAEIPVSKRLITQATPTYAMKAYLEVNDALQVSFPLMKMRKIEREFYKFSGEATVEQLIKNLRVPGVDKRLMLIEPTPQGHKESSIIGHEENVAKLLKISVETVRDRVRALVRRDKIGRTGMFINRELSTDETFEMALNRLAKENPAVRRRLGKD